MSSSTSEATINVLRCVFSRFWYPKLYYQTMGHSLVPLISVNSALIRVLMINHVTSSVHKPSTNRQAERVVQVLKSAA